MSDPEFLRRLERELVAQGKLIEAGWISLRIAAIAPDASAIQLEECRNAFFAGAQHLFSAIMTVLDDDREATEADLTRLDQINAELQAFIRDFSRRHGLAEAEH